MLPVTTVFTLTPAVAAAFPPGPMPATVWLLVACGETPVLPLGPPAVAPLSIDVSTTSAVAHERVLVCPQLIPAGLAVKELILGGATTTWADASPASKRGSGPFLASSSPRFHGDLVTLPFLVT